MDRTIWAFAAIIAIAAGITLNVAISDNAEMPTPVYRFVIEGKPVICEGAIGGSACGMRFSKCDTGDHYHCVTNVHEFKPKPKSPKDSLQ